VFCVELPPGPGKLHEEASWRSWRCFNVQRRVNRGEASWGAVTKAQKKDMGKALRLLRGKVDQGSVKQDHTEDGW